MDTRHPHLRASECLDLAAHVAHVDVRGCIAFCGVVPSVKMKCSKILYGYTYDPWYVLIGSDGCCILISLID